MKKTPPPKQMPMKKAPKKGMMAPKMPMDLGKMNAGKKPSKGKKG